MPVKLLIVLKAPPSTIEVENLSTDFSFGLCCMQARTQGFFQSDGLHIDYDNIAFMTTGALPRTTIKENLQ